MAKVTFKRLYQHGGDIFTPGQVYNEEDIPEILRGFAKVVPSPKKKSKGSSKK